MYIFYTLKLFLHFTAFSVSVTDKSVADFSTEFHTKLVWCNALSTSAWNLGAFKNHPLLNVCSTGVLPAFCGGQLHATGNSIRSASSKAIVWSCRQIKKTIRQKIKGKVSSNIINQHDLPWCTSVLNQQILMALGQSSSTSDSHPNMFRSHFIVSGKGGHHLSWSFFLPSPLFPLAGLV